MPLRFMDSELGLDLHAAVAVRVVGIAALHAAGPLSVTCAGPLPETSSVNSAPDGNSSTPPGG